MALKHVGRIIKTKKKCCVVYRVVPGKPDTCVIVPTESLSADEHDTLIKLVESQTAQDSYELGEAMARSYLPDGRNMLAGFHSTGKLTSVETSAVEMTPDNVSVVRLDELNQLLAEQKGVTIAELALKDESGNTVQPQEPVAQDSITEAYTQPVKTDGVLSDEDLAAQYRSQADSMFKEAKRLREQAEELVPTKKKTTKKTEESA